MLADATVAGRAGRLGHARRSRSIAGSQPTRIVAEVNQGGDMVRAVLREVDAAVPVERCSATRGKWLRAEPVAALYEQGRVAHVGELPGARR